VRGGVLDRQQGQRVKAANEVSALMQSVFALGANASPIVTDPRRSRTENPRG